MAWYVVQVVVTWIHLVQLNVLLVCRVDTCSVHLHARTICIRRRREVFPSPKVVLEGT